MQEEIITLANGLRILYKYEPHTRLVHCGYVVNVGGRDDSFSGIAHFMEHILFKGTEKRKTYHILNGIESVGGDLNAYTTKEKTCMYASLHADQVERAFDILTDIVFFSVFPEKEIEKEKQVVSEEIDMYRDAPDEAIFEDFDGMIFPGHSLGVPILGTKESIPLLDSAKIKDFHRKFYQPSNVVFSVVGNLPRKKLENLIDRHLRHISLPATPLPARLAPQSVPLKTQTISISGQQAHEIIGGRAMSLFSDEYPAFVLLQNIIGGPAMNARLNLNIREKYGWAYNISSFYSPFLDSGIWGVYYACDVQNLPKVRRKVMAEFAALSDKPLGHLQLRQAKQQLTGQLVMSSENLSNQMLGMGKELLDYGHIVSLDTYISDIEAVTLKKLQEVAQTHLNQEALSMISYLPNE